MSPGSVWLAGWLLLPVVGAPLLTHPAYRRFSAPARTVLSGAAGAILLSFAMTFWALLGLRWHALPLLLASVALAWGVRAGLPRAESLKAPAPSEADESPAAALSLAAVGVAFLATLAGVAGSSDLLFFWGPKAQAFASARTIDAAFLTSPQAAHMHPYYPPLVTNLYALSTMAAGRLPWGAAALTFPILLAALAIALPSLLRSTERPWTPAAIAALIVSALALLGIEANVAGNADSFLLLFEVTGIALLLGPRPTDSPRLLLVGLLLAGAVTSKAEGLPFGLAAVLFFSIGERRPRERARALGLLLTPTAISLGVWFLLGRHIFSGYGEYGSLFDIRWERFGLVLSAIGRAFWSSGFALPYLVPLAVLLASRSRLRLLPISVAAALSAFLTATYMLPVPDPVPWIGWSAARTFAPIAALLALSLAGPDGREWQDTIDG